jgi:hypothetical protein
MHIKYWVGNDKIPTLIVYVDQKNDGTLVGLVTNKMSDVDVKKVKTNAAKLSDMPQEDIKRWLGENVATYKKAVKEFKAGRYEVVEEFKV